MAKPGTVPSWATDTNYSCVGGENGTATKATPSATVLSQGIRGGEGINAQYLNYVLNLMGTWFTYLDGLLAEALTWTGAAIFTPSVATTNGVTCTGNTTGSGVKGTGGATDGIGLEGVGTAAGPGVKATGGATGNGAYILANAAKANILLGSTGGADPSTLENGTIWYDGTDIWCRAGGANFKLNA